MNVNVVNFKDVVRDGRQKSNIHFCSPTIVSVFGTRATRDGTDYFANLEVDSAFVELFKKIKKIGSRFGKVYFTVENGKLFIETTDKTNRFSNSLRFELMDTHSNDLTMCFNYVNFSHLMSVIGDREGFKVNLAYVVEQEMGMIYIELDGGDEKYYLMSREL